MTWQAHRVYAAASPELFAAFRENELCATRLFHVKEHAAPGIPHGGLLVVDVDPKAEPMDLLFALKAIQEKTEQPIVYYQCLTWAGSIEEEAAWILDREDRVFEFVDKTHLREFTHADETIFEGDVLQHAMAHVGVRLATHFFALHAGSFDLESHRVTSQTAVPREHPNAPLQGVNLETIVTALHARYGWEELAQVVPVRCFQLDPSIKSSLTFLRRTPWARARVEALYVEMVRGQ